MHISAALIISE